MYISQLIRYARACSAYGNCKLHTNKLLLLQAFQQSRLMAAFRKYKYRGRYNDLVCPYNLSLRQMLSDMFQDNCLAVLYTEIYYRLLRLPDAWRQLASQRVWPVNRGWLLLLGTWSLLWYIQGSVFAICNKNKYILCAITMKKPYQNAELVKCPKVSSALICNTCTN